ncbi:Gfo/Idh/MocA family protein [Chitinophaga lutea]
MRDSKIHRRKFLAAGTLALSSLAFRLPVIAGTAEQAPLRIGVIGTGNRGTGLISLLHKMPGFAVTACCDIIPDKLANALRIAGGKPRGYSDYRTLLEDKQVDAVIIATPLFLHYPMAVAAIDAGKHIYLEKSLSYNINEALDLTERVRKSPLVFQVGYQYRYYGLYKRVKEIIGQNWLGRITHLESQYNRNSDWRVPVRSPAEERIVNWRMYKEYCGGPLSELCAHQIDIIQYLLDSHPTKAVAMGGINYWQDSRETYDHIRAIYEYPGGIQSSVSSVLSNAYDGYSIRIFGEKATVEIQREKAFIYPENTVNARGTVDGVTGATISVKTQGEAEEISWTKEGEQILEPTRYALEDFRRCILEGAPPASNVFTARDSSIAIHIGNLAAEHGNTQYWPKT